MRKEELKVLLNRYEAGIATAEERAIIESWYLEYEPNKAKFTQHQLEEDQQESLVKLIAEVNKKERKLSILRFAAAACILGFLPIGFYFFTNPLSFHPQNLNKVVKHGFPPGGNKATLTLANGNSIVLTGSSTGQLAKQGDIIINKTADGKINYQHTNGIKQQQNLAYNIATTPRGGQFQFVLSDGTNVWLNSASSIKYPVDFIGNERKVELTGEAYFEVAHNARKPFKVVSNGQIVEVLGTHFNINNYSDEGVTKTTLLQGNIKVITPGGSDFVKPGEQAQLKNGKLTLAKVDVDDVVAWKNGFFNFKKDNIQSVMRQLSRWYNVDVKFEGSIPERELSGAISRHANASQILDMLSFKKINYRIEGRYVVITQ